MVAPAMDAHLAGGKPRAHMRNLSVSSSNALENFGHFEDVVQSKRVVVLLDYDGTLTPIVSDPSQVRTKLRSIQSVCSRQGGSARDSRLSRVRASSVRLVLFRACCCQALLSDHTRAVLTELAQPFVVGIVSG